MALTATVTASGDQNLDGVISGIRWDAATLTYSFPESSSYYENNYIGSEPQKGFAPLSQAQAFAARKIFAMFAAVADIGFIEVRESESNHADLRLAGSNISAPAWAYYPSSSPYGGDAWFRASAKWLNDMRAGGYGFYVFMHEIGHALGLKHGHEIGPFGPLPLAQDSMEFSIMTYRSYVGASGTFMENEQWGYAQSLMMNDIAALQHMYGADYTTNSDNTVYRWSSVTGEGFINGVGQGAPGGNRVLTTIWDGGGRDTYDFSNYRTNLRIDLRPGAWSILSSTQIAELGYGHPARGNIANSLLFEGDLRSLIENAIGGSGNDRLFGNQANNVLIGGAGADRLYGFDGMDTLTGGKGGDVFLFMTRPSRYTNLDRINDFSVKDDTISLENAAFTALGKTGRISDQTFWTGAKAHDATDRIVYNKATGALFYDPDGTGSAPQIQFAVLAKGLGLTAADFWVT